LATAICCVLYFTQSYLYVFEGEIFKMAKRKQGRRKRSTSEKVMLILGIVIAISMLLSLVVGLGSGGSSSNAPLSPEAFPEESGVPLSLIPTGNGVADALAVVEATGPPWL
jgi:hypothetical protein